MLNSSAISSILSQIVLVLVSVTRVIAQEPSYRTIDMKDGLPTNCVYKVGQGKDGFIWFFTDKGVSRYDGSNVKNFDLNTDLPGFRAANITHDLDGRIWFSYGNNDLAYTDKGEIHRFQFNQLIKDSLEQSFLTHVAFDTSGTIWFGFRSNEHKSCIASISASGIWQWYNTHYSECTIYAKKIGLNWIQGTHAPVHFADLDGDLEEYQPTMIVDDGKQLRSLSLPKLDGMRYHKVGRREYVLAHELGIYEVANDCLVKICSGNIPANFIFRDNSGNVFVKNSNKILLMFDSTGISFNPQFLFKNNLVTWAMQDKEGSYWVSSMRHGVHHIPSWDIKVYKHPGSTRHNYIRGVTYYHDTLIIPYRDGTICFAKPLQDSLRTKSLKVGKPISSMGISQTEIPAFCYPSAGPRCFMAKGRFPFIKSSEYAISFDGDKVLVGRHKAILLGNLENMTVGNPLVSNKKLYSIFPLSYKHYLFSNIEGVFRIDTGWTTPLAEIDNRLKSPVFHFQRLEQNWIAMASFNEGVLIHKGDRVFQIDTSDGLLSNSCNRLLVEGNSLWVASDKGINELTLDIQDDGINLTNIKAYGYYHGIPIKDVEHFTVDSQFIWIADNGNLYRLRREIGSRGLGLVNSSAYIHKLSATQESYPPTQKPDIMFGSGSVEISFSSICLLDPKGISYRYRLANGDNNWRKTSNSVVVYDKLPPGDYTFEVKAIHEIAKTNSNVAYCSFTITPLFWQTSWFKALLIFLAIGIAYLIFHTRVRAIKKRERLVRMAMSYRDQALRTQMNPHFIYNTLNSIQHHILEENRDISSKHLSKFSRLIRMVFDHSSYNYISLEKDLKALSLYLELEKLRFGDKINFSQEIQPGIDASKLLVPPMLLQPLVENAIIHGILPKGDSGTIRMNIAYSDELLKFCIHDSGNGTTNGELKSEKRRSGSQITFDRIDQFNKENGISKKVSISSKLGMGTSICFFLAIKTKSG